jgi:hypothetical protein
MGKYQVIVGNVGTVSDGDDKEQAERDYRECVVISKNLDVPCRMSGEEVTLFEDGEIIDEHCPDDSMITCTGCEKIVKEHGYCDKDGNGYGDCCWDEHADKCESCKEDVTNA